MLVEQAEILGVLTKYLSALNAGAIWRQAVRDAAVSPSSMSTSDREHVLMHMTRSLGLFLSAQDQEQALSALRGPLGLNGSVAGGARAFEVRLESDISIVRTEARRIVESMGSNGFVLQKVTTVVSELARNIVSYAGHGTVTLTPSKPPERRISISAKDAGTGIPNIALVMSGTYKSRTGLGRGLLGCKRLADKFQLESDKTGTRIEVEIKL